MKTRFASQLLHGKYRGNWMLLAVCALLMDARAALAAPEPMKLSVFVVPQFTVVNTHRAWAPFLGRLGARTGITFELHHSASIPELETQLGRGEPDLALINPYHAVMINQRPGYIVLVRDTTPLTGILVVQTDSNIKSLQQLKGQELAFPAPNAFGASLFIRALLDHEGIHFKPRYLKTHQNVYRHVILGDVAAGGGVRNTLAREPEAVKNKLRVLFETAGVAPHPLVAHPRIPAQIRERIIMEILAMGTDADQPLLVAVGLAAPVRADYVRDYQPLKKYHFQQLVINGEAMN